MQATAPGPLHDHYPRDLLSFGDISMAMLSLNDGGEERGGVGWGGKEVGS